MNRITVLSAAGLCALALAACGSSAKKPASAGKVPGPAFAACMRAHGVKNFPDPQPEGGFNFSSNIDIASPAFRAANKACGDEAPGAIAPPKPSEHQKTLAVKASRCMRAHGITQFPDPTENPPNPAALGSHEVAFGRGGMFWVVDSTDISSPAFDSTARKCGVLSRGIHPPSSSAP
jgi:hypothetical protein